MGRGVLGRVTAKAARIVQVDQSLRASRSVLSDATVSPILLPSHFGKAFNSVYAEETMDTECTKSTAADGVIARKPSRYDTEEKRKKHAERQRAWRASNPAKAKAIRDRSYARYKKDEGLKENLRLWRSEHRKKTHIRKSRGSSARRYYKKTQGAINTHKRWTDEEIDIAFSVDLTDHQISMEIGRSVSAIQQVRIKYKDRKPVGWKSKGD